MKLYETLKKQLKKENNFVTDDEELKKWVVINKAQNFDADLIALLLEDKVLKENFFIDIKGTLVFNQNLFIQFLEQKNYLNDSYTQYKNKVGLTIDGKYLKQRNEVALVWPFKDCILEGGQSKEENKREEIFFNEILAQDEITQLLEPKVLTNAKIYNKDGKKEFTGFTRDAELNKKRGLPEDTITDNLIIKGNNLLALHSLKKEFAGKVKLIYIDPPYNTGNDSFKYNDNFNHSTWLTFMRNRLEVARGLLRDDGVIFVQCDDKEQAYLKVLLDDLFNKDKFISCVVYRRRKSQANLSKNISPIHDYLLCYSKTNQSLLNKIKPNIDQSKYKNLDNDSRGAYVTMPCTNRGGAKYSITTPTGKTIEDEWRFRKETYESLEKDNRLVFPKGGEGKPRYKLFLNEKKENGIVPNSWWDDLSSNQEATREILSLFHQNIFSYPKAEKLIQRVIDMSTDEGDIVLDYHLGSGTTAAVAHKMNRQYIGVEQMGYIEKVAVERLKKVIDGEQGGISKIVNWQGGGSFTYLELKKHNQTFIEQIEEAKDSKALLSIWEQMKVKSFLNYNVDIKKQDESIEEFKKLKLEEQKQHLLEILDKNQLFVNLSSLNDKDFDCSEKEKKVTQDFYQLKKD